MKLSSFDITMIVVFAILGVAGIGGYFYTSGDLTLATERVAQEQQKLDTLKKTPGIGLSPQNANRLRETVKILNTGLAEFAKLHFEKGGNPLAAVKQMDGTEWKQLLDRTVADLTRRAKGNRVALPERFYFGFSRYIPNTPQLQHTVLLQKQLMALSEISGILINAKVDKIEAVKRTQDEDGPRAAAPGGNETDSLKGRVGPGEFGYYNAYPFEVRFTCRNIGELRTVVNDLVKSDKVYVIRWVKVNTSKKETVRMDQLKSELQRQGETAAPATEGDAAAVTPPAPGGTNAPSATPGVPVAPRSERGPVDIFGTETFTVDMRVDLIEWTGKPLDTQPPGTTRPAPKPPAPRPAAAPAADSEASLRKPAALSFTLAQPSLSSLES
ncbi:hypothetical protein DB346_11140 [Verrucomicrobia bacterium LW23]|nr:hypothetical protein DB346_11140 [Verrucomicrobia bacterium LW23]